MGESLEEFNDMGMMQALDIVNATLKSVCYIRENYGGTIKKIILFGTSHGAYLAHLANLICPGLYFWLLDISAYITPYYLKHIRTLRTFYADGRVVPYFIKPFAYLHPEICYDEELYNLQYLYRGAKNKCRIICFQGAEDWMADTKEKERLMQEIREMAQFMLIQKEDVDGILCKNAGHGMEINFFVLFEILMPMLQRRRETQTEGFCLPDAVELGSGTTKVYIDYKSNLPMLKYIGGLDF